MPSNTTTTNSAPDWALPYWGSYLQGASQQSQQPYQQYQGQRVADFSNPQLQGMQMITDRATQGNPFAGQINSTLSSMFGNTGGYGNGGTSSGGGGGYTYQVGPGRDPEHAGGVNPLAQSNPYLNDIISKMSSDTTNAYSTGTAAQNDARAARAGAFGGSAYEQVNQDNAASLAKEIAGQSGQLRFQDFGNRQQLEEARLARAQQAQLANQAAATQMAASANAGNASLANSQAAQRMQALQMAMGYNPQYQDAAQLMNVGGLQQMYSQNLLNQGYQDFTQQQQYPQQQLDQFGNAISRATGGQGTQTQQTNTQSNPWATALGGGMSLAALYSLYNS